MTIIRPPYALRAVKLPIALMLAVVAIVGGALIAQIEGDRGIAPVVNTGDIEIGGIDVDVPGKNAQEARAAGWKLAEHKAWEAAHGPATGDAEISSMVSAVVVEREAIGPHRYIARLGVVFDRGRAGGMIGGVAGGSGGAGLTHSAAMLVIPVLYQGGVAQVYEVRGPWQKAWAEFRTGASAIDYVRPTGAGGDSLLINAGQPGRRSRVWWRGVLDQFAASDVLMPEARLERQWPGGPVNGTFTARYGPNGAWLDSFTLRADDEGGVPAMLNQAIAQFDRIYTDALARGVLTPDSTLSLDHPAVDPALAAVIATGEQRAAAAAAQARASAAAAAAAAAADVIPALTAAPVVEKLPERAVAPAVAASGFSVQFASPDAQAVDAALAGLRGLPGVSAAATTSIAIGGTSVMRVSFTGSLTELAAALRGRGWQVSAGGGALRIRR